MKRCTFCHYYEDPLYCSPHEPEHCICAECASFALFYIGQRRMPDAAPKITLKSVPAEEPYLFDRAIAEAQAKRAQREGAGNG